MSRMQKKSRIVTTSRGLSAAVFIGGSLVAVLAWGCLAELRVYEPGPASRVALYPICCSGMHDVMGKIDETYRLMSKIDRNYRRGHRLPVRQMRDREFAAMEEHARGIAAHAATIAESADLSGASTEDATIFGQLAGRLGSHANALAAAATNKDRTQVREGFARLTSTCNACHALFRGLHNAERNGDS